MAVHAALEASPPITNRQSPHRRSVGYPDHESRAPSSAARRLAELLPAGGV